MVLTGIGPARHWHGRNLPGYECVEAFAVWKGGGIADGCAIFLVFTGACIGHIGPEGLAHRLESGGRRHYSHRIDLNRFEGSIDLVGEGERRFDPEQGAEILKERTLRPDMSPHSQLPADTRLWAALQLASGGTWADAFMIRRRS